MKKFRVAMVVMLIFVGLMTIALPTFANGETFLVGMQAYLQGDYLEASEYFSEVIRGNGEYLYDAYFYKTLAQIRLNDLKQARDTLSEMKVKGYVSGYLHWQLGQLYLNKNAQFDDAQIPEALKELEIAGKLGMDTAEFHRDLGQAFYGQRLFAKAIGEYEKALAQNPRFADCYVNLAMAYKEVGKFDEAEKALTAAVNLGQEKISIYQALGDIKYVQGEYLDATEYYKRALELNPRLSPVMLKIAQTYYKMGNIDLAKFQFKQTIEANQYMYQAYFYLGEIAGKEGKVEEAVRYYEQALSYNQEYADAYIALGNVYMQQGKTYRAMSQFTLAIEKNPEYADAHYYLATAQAALQMREAAIAELRKVLHMNPDHEKALKLLQELI